MNITPEKYRCKNCDRTLHSYEFILSSELERACPNCKNVEDFVSLCDVPGCSGNAYYRTVIHSSLRSLCYKHYLEQR